MNTTTNIEAFYNLVVESIEDYAIFTTDRGGVITSWNTGAANLFGYRQEEIIFQDVNVLYTEEDRAACIPQQEMKEAAQCGRALNERYHLRQSGHLFWGSGILFPLYDQENKLIGFTKVIRNLSTNKSAEVRMLEATAFAHSIIGSAQYPLIVLNPDLSINSASSAFFQFFGISKHAARGKNLFEIWEAPELKVMLTGKLRENTDSEEIEIDQEIAGEVKTLHVRARKLFWQDKATELIKVSIEDITYRKKLEQQRETFISIASHELKTPVTLIRAFAQILERELQETSSPAVQKAIARINEQAVKLSELSADLLNVSQLDTGHLTLSIEQFDLLSLLTDVLEDLGQVQEHHTFTLAKPVSAWVTADKTKIAEVLMNLLNNAVKYSPSADRVEIRMEADPGRQTVTVGIKDFGLGIPEGEKDTIFKRFARSNYVREHNISGHGLGLYIASEIMKHHQGAIWFESEKDQGSEFFISLPLAREEDLRK